MPVSKQVYSNRRRSVLNNPNKADLDKDGKLSGYEKKRGKAIEMAMRKKKAYGGAVKKYAMGGGVRKARYK
tara:strand:- start:601 stop:813 length:213 start_codon:yes stop_codon:yes gene_type:complete